MVKIACEIEANPLEATYSWKFNATLGETIDIPASLIAVDRGRSIAHYTPMTENVSMRRKRGKKSLLFLLHTQ